MNAERPLALSVIGLRPTLPARERQRRQFALAEAADEEGYSLLDMFEVGRTDDAAVYETVAARANRGDVRALVVSGAVDRARLVGVAAEAHLRMVDVSTVTAKARR